MKDNKLDSFNLFLEEHISFTIGLWEQIEIPDEKSFSKEQLEKFPRNYDRTVACGQNFNDLYQIRNEALQFLHDLNQQYHDTFQVLIDYSIEKLKNIRRGYYRIKLGNHNYMTHKNIRIIFDSTYYDFFTPTEDDPFETIIHEDYLKIQNYLNTQLDAIDAIFTYIESLTGKPVKPGTEVQEEIALIPEKSTYILPKKKADELKAAEKKIYTIKDLAGILKVSTRTIYNWKDLGILPYSQIGSKTYISAEQLADFLKHHEVKALKMRRGL